MGSAGRCDSGRVGRGSGGSRGSPSSNWPAAGRAVRGRNSARRFFPSGTGPPGIRAVRGTRFGGERDTVSCVIARTYGTRARCGGLPPPWIRLCHKLVSLTMITQGFSSRPPPGNSAPPDIPGNETRGRSSSRRAGVRTGRLHPDRSWPGGVIAPDPPFSSTRLRPVGSIFRVGDDLVDSCGRSRAMAKSSARPSDRGELTKLGGRRTWVFLPGVTC